MTDYYDRRWQLDVDGKPFIEQMDGAQFKITFQIIIDFGGSNSYADIAVYNLREDTVGKIFASGKPVSFKAGYVDTVDTVFIGVIQNVLRERQGANTITRLICRSETIRTVINQSFGAGVDIVTLIRSCSTSAGYPAVIEPSQFDDVPVYSGGYVLSGDPRILLDTLARAHGFTHTVENGRRIILRNGFKRNTAPFVVSQFTGMEGIPEITEIGCDVTVRLSPKIRIGGEIDIRSQLSTFNFGDLYYQNIPESAGKGIYKVQKIEHTGDSYGDTWSTKITSIR
jgi:hypothetical protein